MSALTKLFVVLMVVCSLLMSASLVVFVNRVEDFQKTAKDTNAKLVQAEANRNKANEQLASERHTHQSDIDAGVVRETQLQTQITDLQSQLASAKVEIAQVQTEKKVAETNVTKLTHSVDANTEENKALQTYLAQTQQSNDKLVTQNKELNISVSELTGKNDALDKQRKFFEEQVEQQKKQISQMSNVMQTAGIKYDSQTGEAEKAGQAIVGTPGQLIGQITTTTVIGGVPYASISLGSSDNVTSGMKFYVINRDSGEFFGTLVVENVEPTAAIGRLDGPKVQQVAKGLEVKTQL